MADTHWGLFRGDKLASKPHATETAAVVEAMEKGLMTAVAGRDRYVLQHTYTIRRFDPADHTTVSGVRLMDLKGVDRLDLCLELDLPANASNRDLYQALERRDSSRRPTGWPFRL